MGLYCERELEIEHNCNILTLHSYGRHVVSFLFSWCSTGGLGVICYILSATSQAPKLHRGSRGPPRAGVAFPTTSLSNWPGTQTQLPATQLATSTRTGTRLSDIMVQRPLDLWNRMFDRHQAEITVMQFTGHSLPVHQSMSVLWEFFSSSHFNSQFPPTRFPLLTAIRMCHLLPVHHLGMACLAGSEGQNTTIAWRNKGMDSYLSREN